ncbi:23214_t:CDS:2, partial [Gigaspora margarita]
MLQATRLSEHKLQEIHRPLLKLIKNKAELQVTTSTSLLKHKGTEALATELRLRQEFNDTRIVNVMSDRRNRKLTSEYIISGYNLLALFIALLVVSLDKRKKELVLVENKDNDKKIFKIIWKGKAKILGEYYCNIPLADPNQFEIKKCKGCSGNTAKITGKINER